MVRSISSNGTSTVPSPLDNILALASAPEAVLTGDDVAEWPTEFFDLVSALGLVRAAAPAKHAECDQCAEGHIELVHRQRGKGDAPRFFITCPEAGRVLVGVERLKRWAIDYDALATAVAKAISASATVESLVAARAWRLGALVVTEQSYSVVLFRGAAMADSADVLTRAFSTLARSKSILLAVDESVDLIPDSGEFAAVIALASVVRIRDKKVWIDQSRIEAAIPATMEIADKPVVDENARSLTYRNKTCRFSARAEDQFALFKRLNRRPNQPVQFNTMRQPGDVFGDYAVADVSIRSAVRRLRARFEKAQMGRLARCLRTADRYAILDLSHYDSTSH